MDELETLNMLLRLIGSSPVNSLSTDHPDAANAKATMARVSKRIQRKGWWCNIEYDLVLTPNENGELLVAGTVSSLVMEDRSLILRGKKVYDKRAQTATFTEHVVVTRLVRILEWDDMPQVMQETTAYSAAAEFVRDELEDATKEASLKEEAGKSYLDLKKQELEEGQYNVFQKSRVLRARAGIMPYERNNRRFFGDPDV